MPGKEKLILNRDVELWDDEPTADESEPAVFLSFDHTIITISPVMKELLLACRTACSLEQLVEAVAERNNLPIHQLKTPVRRFVKQMKSLGVLLSYRQYQQEEDTDTKEPAQGQRFGDYILQEKIDSNSTVAIFKCTHSERSSVPCAIKILTDRKGESAFAREFYLLDELPAHPNIRQCIDKGKQDSFYYMVMEYIDGHPLSAITHKIPLAQKLTIALQLIDTVGHLHRHRILHGDIHASNFLIDNHHQLHLIDLGMAYHEDEEDVSHGGVPRYMPPERMPRHNYHFSKRQGDYVAEVFQVGICLYLLFSGRYPFRGKLLKDLRAAIQHETPAPLTLTEKEEPVPQDIANIIFKSLAKNPSARYQSLSAMSRDWTSATQKLFNQPNSDTGATHNGYRGSTTKKQ